MKDDDRAQYAIDTIRATPVSDDANTMLLYLGRCEDENRVPDIHDLGWDRERAQLAIIELKVRGFISNPNAS